MSRHLTRCCAVLAAARLAAALSVGGQGDWPFGAKDTELATSTAAPVRKTAEEQAEAAERRREQAEKLLEEVSEKGARLEEAARLHEQKVELQEAQMAEKRALAEKRKKAQAEADAIRQEKMQRRQLAKVEASDRQGAKLKKLAQKEFEEDEENLEAMMQQHAQELEQQKADEERIINKEKDEIRRNLSELGNHSVAQAEKNVQRRGRSSLIAALKNANVEDAAEIVHALSSALQGRKLPRAADLVAVEMEVLASDFVQKSTELTGAFVRESTNPDRDVARMLSKFFNDTANLAAEHDASLARMRKELIEALPEKARPAGEPLAALLITEPLKQPDLNHTAFRMAEESGVCGEVPKFMSTLDAFHRNVSKVHRMLNVSAGIMPKLKRVVPDTNQQVMGFLENMLRLLYVEVNIRESEAVKAKAAVTTEVMERLFCAAAAPRGLAGLAVTLLASAYVALF